jgi:hypothetical protein
MAVAYKVSNLFPESDRLFPPFGRDFSKAMLAQQPAHRARRAAFGNPSFQSLGGLSNAIRDGLRRLDCREGATMATTHGTLIRAHYPTARYEWGRGGTKENHHNEKLRYFGLIGDEANLKFTAVPEFQARSERDPFLQQSDRIFPLCLC